MRNIEERKFLHARRASQGNRYAHSNSEELRR